MTSIGSTLLFGLLILCVGVLLGATWTVQALGQQFRRLAIKRRELNALRLTRHEISLRCSWCGNVIDYPDDLLTGVPGDQS